MNLYHVTYVKSASKDLDKIRKYSISKKYYEKNMQEITNNIEKLKYMPRIHKTLICINEPNGEYRRRMVSGKYSIIYKIENDEIIILRIFNQKENYLNQKKFILREKPQKYVIC